MLGNERLEQIFIHLHLLFYFQDPAHEHYSVALSSRSVLVVTGSYHLNALEPANLQYEHDEHSMSSVDQHVL